MRGVRGELVCVRGALGLVHGQRRLELAAAGPHRHPHWRWLRRALRHRGCRRCRTFALAEHLRQRRLLRALALPLPPHPLLPPLLLPRRQAAAAAVPGWRPARKSRRKSVAVCYSAVREPLTCTRRATAGVSVIVQLEGVSPVLEERQLLLLARHAHHRRLERQAAVRVCCSAVAVGVPLTSNSRSPCPGAGSSSLLPIRSTGVQCARGSAPSRLGKAPTARSAAAAAWRAMAAATAAVSRQCVAV
jgi:hypothetical protein